MILIVGGSYQGKIEYAKQHFSNHNIWNGLHLFVKEKLENNLSEEQILDEIHKKTDEGHWVLISDELGNGIVPIDEKDTKWREVTGRILILLAKEADEVYRVLLGMGQRIK